MAISVFDLFTIGIGPSSSHTVGPMRAAKLFVDDLAVRGLLSAISRVHVEMFGSLGSTGKDAMSHNLEALCSPFYHPMAEGVAVEGIRIVQQYLPRAFADGSDIEARTQMLVCSSMGAMHALAHPLGALYDAHHGTLNAILMPYVLHANRSVIGEKLTRLTP